MKRTKRGEQSAFSLFPFLAVLLCTMGAMVVLLVAMAHVSRQKATREAEIARAAAEAARAAQADSAERKAAGEALAVAKRQADAMRRVREEGERRLAEEQRRISGVEDHLRRLVEEVEEMQAETQELVLIEEEHYDDEKIAEQELERLNALIGQLEDEIEQLEHAAAGRQRKYAVVQLRDRTSGTVRPPVYYECDAEGVVLQPEGIRLAPEDLVAPQFSSPVAATSRAVTRYYEENPEARAANEAGVPYPLLVVRPEGVNSYYLARIALDAAGVKFGYQPIGDDWPLEYGDPNPVLARWVNEALLVSREQRKGLARVVPRLASELSRVERDGLAPRGVAMAPVAGDNRQAGYGGGVRVSRTNPSANNPFEGLRIEGRLPGEGQPTTAGLSASEDGEQSGPLPGGGAESGPQPGPSQFVTANTNAGASANGAQAVGAQQSGAGNQAQSQQGGAAASGSSSPSQAGASQGQAVAVATAESGQRPGPGGAPGQGSAPQRSGVPMVRPIRLYVSRDQVVVLPERAQSPADLGPGADSQSVSFTDLTSSQINDLIAVLKRHADGWGIAGEGLYWDPRLVLNVTSDGAQRANEVRQLLEAAGLKVQAYPVATAAQPGGDRATR